MLNLDLYMSNSMPIVFNGETIHVLEPSLRMLLQIDRLEEDLNQENLKQKRLEIATLLLNHNQEGIVFCEKDIENIPFEGIERLVMEIANMRLRAENDPN